MGPLSPPLVNDLCAVAHTDVRFFPTIRPYTMHPLAQAATGLTKDMRAILTDPSSFMRTATASVVTVAALALLGLVLAYWTWAWLAPRPESRVRAAEQPGGQIEAAYGLFGNAQQDRDRISTGGAVKLLGVVADPRTRSGYAVLRLDAKRTVAVREGGEIESGMRLIEVRADHVVLERNGQRETLAWPEHGKALVSGATRTRN
jgi:general secretion pathway protein C